METSQSRRVERLLLFGMIRVFTTNRLEESRIRLEKRGNSVGILLGRVYPLPLSARYDDLWRQMNE